MTLSSGVDVTDPEAYKNSRYFKKNTDIEDIYSAWDNLIDPAEAPKLEIIVRELAASPPADNRAFESALQAQRKKHKISFRKAQLLHVYNALVYRRHDFPPCKSLAKYLVKKSSKSQSGVLVITVLTSPYPKVRTAGFIASPPVSNPQYHRKCKKSTVLACHATSLHAGSHPSVISACQARTCPHLPATNHLD